MSWPSRAVLAAIDDIAEGGDGTAGNGSTPEGTGDGAGTKAGHRKVAAAR